MYLCISSFQCSSFLLEGPDFYQVSFPSAQRTSFSISYSPGLVTADLSLILNLSLFHFHSFFFFFFFLMENEGQYILVVVHAFGSQLIAKQSRASGPASGGERHVGTTFCLKPPTWTHQSELLWPGFHWFSRLLKGWSIVKEMILARNACLQTASSL